MANGAYGENDTPLESTSGAYGANDKPVGNELSKKNTGLGGDVVTALKQGVQQIPGMVTGLADIPAGMFGMNRPVSRLADVAGQATGFQPSKWAKEAESEYSDATKEGKAKINQAWEDPNTSAMDVAGAYLSNPRTTAINAVQSVPAMLAGGLAGRAVGVIGGLASAPARAAIGEGAVMAGSAMDQISPETDPQRAAAAALATGVGGSLLGYAGGRIAQRLGITDLDALTTGGTRAGAQAATPMYKRIPAGMVQEGLVEEAPQSALETASQNWAEGKPLTQGMARSVTEGALAGGLMGGIGGALPQNVQAKPAADVPQVESDSTLPADKPLQIGNTPDPMISFADGTVGRQSEVDKYINGLPPDQQPAARAKLMGMAPQPAKPSESMGLTPTAAPSLTNAAILAVDSGASQPQIEAADPVQAAQDDYRTQTAALLQQQDEQAYEAYMTAIEQASVAQDEAPGETIAAVTPIANVLADYDNLSDDEFFAALGATPEETQDAIANQPSSPQASVADPAVTAPDVAASAGEGTPAVDAKSANLARIKRASQKTKSANKAENVSLSQPGQLPLESVGQMGQSQTDQQGASVPQAPLTQGEESGRMTGVDVGSSVDATSSQPAVQLNNTPAAQTGAPLGVTSSPAAEASPAASGIKAIVAKKIPDMSDDELQQAIAHYGPEHPRTAKLTKAANVRALAAKIQVKPTESTLEKTDQAQPQQTQREEAPKAFDQLPDLTPDQREVLDPAMARDFEKQYQQDLVTELKRKRGLLPEQKDDELKRSPFKTFLITHGVSDKPADVVGEGNAFRANNIIPTLFRKNGIGMDELVNRAAEAGFITQAEADNGEGVPKLVEMIRSEVAGTKRHLPLDMQDESAEQRAEQNLRLEVEADAQELGLVYDPDMDTRRLQGMVMRVRDRVKRAPKNGLLKPDRILKNARDAATRIEQKRAQLEAQSKAFADLNQAEQDAALDIFTDEDGNVQTFMRTVDAQAISEWIAANPTQVQQDGTDARATQDVRQDQAPTPRVTAEGAGRGQATNTSAQQGSAQGTGAIQEGVAKPLYASRAVTNAADIIAWAQSQGFKTTLPADDMHVTVAYSSQPVDGAKAGKAAPSVNINDGTRKVEPLGDAGAVVLKFSSDELQDRWKQYRDIGASWDYDGYTPHITLTYDAAGLDLSKVTPYTGPIRLGAETQEALNEDKADEYAEEPTLTAPTRADVLAQQAAREAEEQRKKDGGDKPIQRKVTADQVDLFNPQGSIFDAPAEPAQPAAVSQVTEPPVSKTETTAKAEQPAQPAGKYQGPADVSTRAGQMELANRAGRIASLKAMNGQLRQIAPNEAWADANIESANDLDALQDQISAALVAAGKGTAAAAKVPDALRTELEEMSGAELKAVFAEMNLAGKILTHDERVDMLMAEDAAEVRAAIGKAQPAAQEPAKAAKIEDSGEVLEGARKLYAKSYAAKMDEGMGMDTAAVPLSKSWPEPDYQRLLDEGADPWAVAMAHAMRDEIPTKPSTAWKVKGWAGKVEILRGMAADAISGKLTRDRISTKVETHGLHGWLHKIDLYQAVGHAKSLKGITFGLHEYGMYGGQTFSPAKKLWVVNVPSASGSTWKNGNWGNDLVVADTKEEAIEKFKVWHAAQGEAAPTEAKATSFDIYSYRSKPNVFIIGKRISATKSIDLKEFPTAKEAREYKAANQAELERLLSDAKFEPSERREENSPRVGADHRNGADVTSEQFRDTFGFRGEQFGASMPQAERQANMNQAYDALMDLAGVIGVPPKALSLNGELGLAFGARGTGGKNAAAAHYERDTTGEVTPNRVVINLTRKNGAGSLAHEWFHAVDNYFARMRGEKGGMLTEKPYERGEGVRPEMLAAFKQLMATINLSGIKERSKQLDKKRVKDYWSTGLEMAARSFESYVIAKLQDKDGANDYLANIVPEELYAMQASYPYPVMGEMPAIRAAFDDFFKTVQTKETDKGVAMFSRGDKAATGLSRQSVQDITNAIKARWANSPEVVVADNMEDPAIPQAVRDEDAKQRSQGASGSPEGFYYRGKVYLVASEMATPGDVIRVLLHEALGHAGLRGVFGKDLNNILRQIVTMRRKDVAAKAEQYGLDMNKPDEALQAAEEVLAEMAQAQPNIGFVTRAIAAIRTFLRDHVPGFEGMKLTDAEIINSFIMPARNYVKSGKSGVVGGIAFSRGANRQSGVLSKDGKFKAWPYYKAWTRQEYDDVVSLLPEATRNNPYRREPLPAEDWDVLATEVAAELESLNSEIGVPGAFLLDSLGNIVANNNKARTQAITRYAKNIADKHNLGIYVTNVSSMSMGPLRDSGFAGELGLGGILQREALAKAADANAARQAAQAPIYRGTNAYAVDSANQGTVMSYKPRGFSPQVMFSRGASAKDQTDTAAFKAWFAGSKVVGEDGKPLVMYHGTPDATFTIFKPESYFTSQEDIAKIYTGTSASSIASSAKKGEKPDVYAVYLSIKKPFDTRIPSVRKLFKDKFYMQYGTGTDLQKSGLPDWNDARDLADWINEEGLDFDGIVVDEGGIPQNDGSVRSRGVSYIPLQGGAQIKSATDNNGNFDPANPDIRYSRTKSMGATLADAANNVRDVKLPADYVVGDFFNSAPGKLGWWHKTVGTQYHLAQKSPAFKRVFDSVQTFLNDVSYYATEAADLAPNILPKLETWKDIGKKPVSAEDTKAFSRPVFEGTLTWGRDESGKPVRQAVLEAQAAKLTTEQKGQRLLRGKHISESVLKMWQGLPIDQYEAMIEGKYERDMLKPGIVFTPAELKQLFNLTPNQIKLYQEFRSATDRSLTNLAIADMLRFGGDDVFPIREAVLESVNVQQAADTLSKYLLSLTDIDPARTEVLTDTANKMIDKGDKAKDLMDRGYAPLSRFGQYTLDVVDASGERVYFGMFESKWEAARMNRQMREAYPDATINQGTVSEQAYKMFAGVSPETLALFGDMLGLEQQGDSASAQAFQEYLKLAKSNRSAMKRLIQRKGIAGFNEDAGRVLAGFVYSNARQTSTSLHMGEMTNAANDMPQQQGEIKDAAVKLVDYIKNPQEEAQAFRGLLFAQYIGGSVASAMVNMTQPLTMTLPWLSQYGGAAKSAKQMTAAMKDSIKKLTGDAKLDAAIKRAEEDGTVSPQEVHQLMQQSQGKGALRSGDGTRLGDMAAQGSNALSRFSLGWGKLFSAAEQFNRRVTFIAAYRTAVEQKIADPDAFARKAIAETQGVYNKGNKPQWARGAIGGTLFTFKQYSVAYVEMLQRMSKNGPEGKKAALLALGILFLLSGASGLPGSDDLDDIISGAMQSMGYNFDSKQRRQEFFVEMFGEGGAQFMERGISGLPGVPIDVSGRMGLGNLIPGTGIFQKKIDHSRDVAEIFGPGGDLVKRGYEAAGKLIKGEVLGYKGALATASPKAMQNLYQAYDMANMGMYRDMNGKKVLDSDAGDAMVKALGFQPNDVARVQDASFDVQRMIGVNKMRESEIADKWAKGLFEKDPQKVAAARLELQEWNTDNPSSPIRINFRQIQQRLKAMNATKAERLAKTAPRELRAAVKAELAIQ